MSTRQRSFFDQKPKAKPFKGQWNRPRNAPGPPYNNNNRDGPCPPPAVTGPPIMPSSQTRKKIKAFAFSEGAPSSQDMRKREGERARRKVDHTIKDGSLQNTTFAQMESKIVPSQDKENKTLLGKPKDTPKISRTVQILDDKTSATPRLEKANTCPFPSTPATRLPLADLVGNADDTNRRIPQPIESPEEQLCWRGSQPVNTPLPRRKRKRARSSSPAGGSQEEVQFPSITANLDTPQADPAAELWNRYTSTKGTPSTKKGVAFAHLLNDPSPRSSADAGSVSGLRRWTSCGAEFPTSATKRRKTSGTFRIKQDDNEDVFSAPSSDGIFKPPPKKSRLAGMLEEMSQSVARPPPKIPSFENPSSSSPLPEIVDRRSHPSSPLQHHAHANDSDTENLEVQRSVAAQEIAVEEPQRSFSASSDDFGGEDFDAEMVEALDISQDTPKPAHCDHPDPSNDGSRLEPPTIVPLVIDTGSEDEFGLDDDDFCAADLEQVASLYDARPEISTQDQAEMATADSQPELQKARVAPVINLDDDDDDFGDDDIDVDDFAEAEDVATQSGPNNSQHDARSIQRYKITRVDEGTYTTERGYMMPQKVLVVEEEKTKLYKLITLRQAWYHTPCTPDSFVHVIGTFSSTGQCLIDDSQNMLILHPDHLISATVVADSFTCLRRAVLQDRIKASSRANEPMLYGTLLHELFQEAMKVNRWDTDFLLDTVDGLLPSKYETILEINLTCAHIKEHLSSKLPELQAWAEIFVRAEPRVIVRQRNGRQSIMSINKLLDVEEHVWSPMYGLKGNIDATVQVSMQDEDGERTLMVPFEVKTGKNSSNPNHVAQTALYNLLLSNRYDVDVAYGILYYLETSDTSRIPAMRNEIIHMIIKRNELACYVRDRIELPSMLKEDFKCGKCYAQESCFLYNKLVEDGDGELLNKKAKERYDDLVKYLKPSDRLFMKKWDSLLTKEESDMMKFRRELWTMLSDEREKLGRCFSNVILEPGSGHEEKTGQKINRFRYTFVKQLPKPGFSFTESQLTIGEPVVVSDEKGHFALANGYVTNVAKRRISIAVDRRLHNARTKLPGFHSQTNQTFAGIMEVSKEGDNKPIPLQNDEQVLYRLDKDEFSNGMAAARNNLIQIMDDSVYKARDLRSLIIDGRAPDFKPVSTVSLPSTQPGMTMNNDQKAAITKVMSAKEYALVLGMPGTGKTTTIAHIIRSLVAKGKSVLLTSYTHTAVDNILLKIKRDDIGILRLGSSAKVHPEVREFAILASEQKESLEELEKSWMQPPVVATTCLTIGHPLFNRRVFDYCIVDEASQITLPVCLGPIRMAKTFILVGDHHQLPPLVQNKDASEGGLDVSLFKMLCEAHPQAVVSLEHQYRMCADIMLLSNTFIYNGRLKCGTPAVASRQLQLPNPAGLDLHHYHSLPSHPLPGPICPGGTCSNCWLNQAVSPNQPVIFINTDRISTMLESQSGSRITNTLEARLVTHLTISLLSAGISPTEVGVIAFYRSQLALLRQSLSAAHTQTTQSSDFAGPATGSNVSAIELHTADKFQGRDKEIVLVSCVRSNENGVVGDLLKDSRRVNVALTRARSKLIILGSEKTLSNNELLRDLVTLCREKGWTFDIEQAMVDGHLFEEGITQTGITARSSYAPAPSCKQQPRKLLTPSPTKNGRAVLGDITKGGKTNQRTPSASPEVMKAGRKAPAKVFRAGRRGVLDSRPILRDVFNGAM